MVGRRRFEGDRPSGAAPPTHDEVPDSVVQRAKDAFERRAPGDLAAMVFDSAIDDPARVGGRLMRFEHPGGWVEIVVNAVSGDFAIRGRASPAPHRVELEPEGRDVALVSEVGEGTFEFPAVPSGLVRLLLIGPPASPPVHTDWVRV